MKDWQVPPTGVLPAPHGTVSWLTSVVFAGICTIPSLRKLRSTWSSAVRPAGMVVIVSRTVIGVCPL